MSKTTPNDTDDAANDDAQTETFNAFGRHGVVVEEPEYLVYLEDADEKHHHKYGTDRPAFTPRRAAEWLLMAVKGVPFGDVGDRVEDDEPIIVLEKRGEYTRRFNAATGNEVSGE